MVLNNTHGTLERISSVRQIAFRLHRRCHLKPVFFLDGHVPTSTAPSAIMQKSTLITLLIDVIAVNGRGSQQ